MVVFWIAVAVLVTGLAGGTVVAFVRGRAMWKQLKHTSGAIGDELERISVATAEIDRHLEAAGASQTRLSEARERFAASKARLDLQLAAVNEARRTIDRMLWFLPGR